VRTTEEEPGVTVIVPHDSTQQAAIETLDGAANKMLTGAGNASVKIVDQKKSWDGPKMNFSFTGKVGFISVPLTGTVTVDDTNVTLECELPAMVKNFVGEDKARAMVEERLKALIHPPDNPVT
jgi:hypothetical protein